LPVLVCGLSAVHTSEIINANSPKTEDQVSKRPILRLATLAYKKSVMEAESKIVRRAFELTGYQQELVTLPSMRAIRSAAAGTVDGVVLRSQGSEKIRFAHSFKPTLRTEIHWVWVNPETLCPSQLSELSKFKQVIVLWASRWQKNRLKVRRRVYSSKNTNISTVTNYRA